MLSPSFPSSLIVVDIGNSRIKFGAFSRPQSAVSLAEPIRTLSVAADETQFAQLDAWSAESADHWSRWLIASVNRDATQRLTTALRQRGINEAMAAARSYRLLMHDELPVVASVDHPQQVGIDRLLQALGVNRLRRPDEPAIAISVGSAITVNLIDRDGAFMGGAILPGIGMAARALHDFTDQLPLIEMDELLDPPAALGKSTLAAMRSGLYYGAIGAMQQLIEQLAKQVTTNDSRPQVFLTGGAAPIVAELLGPDTVHVPHLVLSAMASLAEQLDLQQTPRPNIAT